MKNEVNYVSNKEIRPWDNNKVQYKPSITRTAKKDIDFKVRVKIITVEQDD